MRALPAHLANVIASDALTIATCWRVKLQTGEILRYTDHHDNVVVGAETFSAGGSFSRSAVGFGLGLAEDSLEVSGTIGADSITATDLLAGKYDYARVEMFITDYRAPNSGIFELCAGEMGEVEFADGEFRAQLYGLATLLRQSEIELCSPTCRANLGDSRCKVALGPHQWTGAITEVLNAQGFRGGAPLSPGALGGGTIEFLTGANAGLLLEVKGNGLFFADLIGLFLPTPYAMQLGDTYRVTRGCDKRPATCRDVFNNIINFRGEPFVPGNDKILQINNAKPAEPV